MSFKVVMTYKRILIRHVHTSVISWWDSNTCRVWNWSKESCKGVVASWWRYWRSMNLLDDLCTHVSVTSSNSLRLAVKLATRQSLIKTPAKQTTGVESHHQSGGVSKLADLFWDISFEIYLFFWDISLYKTRLTEVSQLRNVQLNPQKTWRTLLNQQLMLPWKYMFFQTIVFLSGYFSACMSTCMGMYVFVCVCVCASVCVWRCATVTVCVCVRVCCVGVTPGALQMLVFVGFRRDGHGQAQAEIWWDPLLRSDQVLRWISCSNHLWGSQRPGLVVALGPRSFWQNRHCIQHCDAGIVHLVEVRHYILVPHQEIVPHYENSYLTKKQYLAWIWCSLTTWTSLYSRASSGNRTSLWGLLPH